MGISEDPAMAVIGNEEMPISSLLTKLQGSRHSVRFYSFLYSMSSFIELFVSFQGLWLWSGFPSNSRGLLWDTRKMPFLVRFLYLSRSLLLKYRDSVYIDAQHWRGPR